MNQTEAASPIRVWDLPVRLFHWLLVLLIIVMFVTGKLGGNWLEWHKRAGFFVLGLVLIAVHLAAVAVAFFTKRKLGDADDHREQKYEISGLAKRTSFYPKAFPGRY